MDAVRRATKALILTSLLALFTVASEGSANDGTLKLGFERDLENFEPHRNYGASSPLFQGHIYETLIGYDAEGNLVGRLAESWDNPDPLTWIFHLRHGVKFHDGGDFAAQDVVFSLNRIKEPETAATRGGELAVISSLKALDDYTVKIRLAEPFGALLVTLSLPDVAMLDKQWSEAGHDYDREMNGTGPFRLDSYERNVQYSLRRNENYWREGIPHLDGVDIIPINDTPTRVNALLSGDVDFVTLIPWERFAELESNPDFQMTKTFDSFMLLRLNPNRPPFDDVRVRQAFNYALDRDALSTLAWGGEAQPMTAGLIRPESRWFNPAAAGHWTYDPDKARVLLAEAGLKPADVKFALYSIPFVHLPTAEVVVQQLKDFGMDVTLQTIENAVLHEKRANGDYQAMMDGGSNAVADPNFYALWFASTGGNYAKAVGFSVPELDKLLIEARNETNFEARKSLIWKAEQIILDQAPWGFLVFRPQAEGYAAKVKGYYRVPGFGSDSPIYLKMDTVLIE
jgi:peptide/nickel transport system substrate-binding protein